jgi:hypothetical protein
MVHPRRRQRRSGCAARQGASSEEKMSEKGADSLAGSVAGTRSAAADWSAETESADWSAETESAVERPGGEPVDTSREVASAGSTPPP